MPADIIILAAIAVFVLLRLRSVLGHKIGNDTPPRAMDMRNAEAERIVTLQPRPEYAKEPEPVITTVEEEPAAQWGEEIADGIAKLRAVDAQFSMQEFLEGAKGAFEMVLTAFAKDDRETLQSLLNKDIYASFAKELDARKKEEKHIEATLVAILSATPTAIEVKKSRGRITVKFDSEQIEAERDAAGKLIEGSTTDIHAVEDIWMLERDMASSNPNWTIVAT